MNKRKEKIVNLFKALIIMATIVIASYAWFSNKQEANINDLKMTTKGVCEIEFSLDGGKTWTESGGLNLREDFKFNNEITSNGIDFFVPSYKTDDGIPLAFKKAVANYDYLEFTVLFRSTVGTGIFLENKSFVHPSAGTTLAELIGPEVVRKSNLGDFSRDLIAGSVRVAFIENDYVDSKYVPKNETTLVWAPNKNYYMSYNNGIYNASIDTYVKQNYLYVNNNVTPFYTQQRVANIRDDVVASYEEMDAHGSPLLTYISNSNEPKSITVRIWIEGNDRETVTALKGGIFNMYISFMGISKDLNVNTVNVTKNGMGLSGFISGMEYSKDYGVNWISYNQDNNPIFTAGEDIYVRYSESSNYFASEYVELNY
ncbi:MAG: hypothetical protein PHQ64_01060 [Bacilli bacterium]|nr:hypothetical protein [Bacilli bacterium]